MYTSLTLRFPFHFIALLIISLTLLGHVPKAKGQIIRLDQRYWIVRDRGPDEMVKDLSPSVRVDQPGHYRLLGNILYNSGNQQLNESFFMLIRGEDGQTYYPLDSNTAPAPYKVVPDDSVDGKHRVWRDAGLFYLPEADQNYTIEFHHYAEIWDDIPYYLNEQHYDGERNAESLNVDAIQLNLEPTINGAIALTARGTGTRQVGGRTFPTVAPEEHFTYDILVRNLELDVLQGATVTAIIPDSVNISDPSPFPTQVDGSTMTWTLPDIAPKDSLHITMTAAAAGHFVPGFTPLIKNVELVAPGDIDLRDNRDHAAVLVFVEPWPSSPTADVQVDAVARTDSFRVVNGDTIKYVKPGETYELTLILENIDSETATNVFLYNQPPAYLSQISYSQTPQGNAQGYSYWTFPSMAPGERVIISATATVDAALTTPNLPLRDELIVFSENDDLLDNNTDEETVLLAYEPPGPPSNTVDVQITYRAFSGQTAIIDGIVEQAVAPGDSVRYSLILRNNGPRDAMNVRAWVDVPDSAHFSQFSQAPKFIAYQKSMWAIDEMAAFEEREITFRGTTTDSLPFLPFPLPSKAGIHAAEDTVADNNFDSTRVFVTDEISPALADVYVSQRAITDSMAFVDGDSTDVVDTGESYQLEITVGNRGPAAAKNIRLVDLLPDSVAVSNIDPGAAFADSDSLVWNIGELAPQDERIARFTLTVVDSMPQGLNWLINRVRVDAENEIPGTQGDNAAVDSVLNRVGPPPPVLVDVSISQDNLSDSTLVVDGDTVSFAPSGETYKIAVTLKNNSAHEARNVRLFDLLPDSVSASQFSVVPKKAGRDTVEWTFPTLAAKAERRIEFDAFVSAAMPVGERWLVNRVFVNAENENPDSLANNTSADSVFNRVEGPVTKVVDVSVSQSARTDSAIVINGDSVRLVSQINAYQVFLTVKNLGEDEARDVRLVDQFPDSVWISDFSVDPETSSGDSASWTFTSLASKEERSVSFLVTLPDSLPPGDYWYINRARVSAKNENESHLQNNSSVDSVLYRVKPSPPGKVNLQVTQTALSDSTVMENGEELPYIRKGEVFKIYITVRNNSNAVAEDVVLSEKLADLGLLLGLEPAADEVYDDSLRWNIGRMDPLQQLRFTLDVQLGDEVPPGRHTLNYRAAVSGTNEIETGKSDNVALLTVINETIQPPVTASIRSLPPAVDVGDSIHVDVRVDGPVASYDIWAYLADGEVDSTFADNFIAAHTMTPHEWLSVNRGFTIEHLRSDGREEPIIFELRALDLNGRFVNAQSTTMVVSSNYLVLDKNVFKSEEEDFLGIRFKLSYRREATLDIYDLNGRHITQVTQDVYDGGWTTYYWNGMTTDGQKVGSGVYLVTLRSGEFSAYKKFILVR